VLRLAEGRLSRREGAVQRSQELLRRLEADHPVRQLLTPLVKENDAWRPEQREAPQQGLIVSAVRCYVGAQGRARPSDAPVPADH